ncbi:hypothetical protein PX701_12480 [Agromyces sp. H3Y2-19a]|uniref:hypothetical protein n=1 Tax=Agromyces chromiiresistens TaxID=3030835 RepID=UPI0023B8E718|nr:hypothetical protein [Agromyces chromiiresistens]MDF0514441.1 hypothetical protein [Agromyces chromiiresistens]
MSLLAVTLSLLGEIARARTLRARGVSARDIRAALDAGAVTAPRTGWIASPLADRDQIRAVQVGGRIACVSALGRLGLWGGDDRRLHLQVPHSASRRSPWIEPTKREAAGVWQPKVPERRRERRFVLLAGSMEPRIHYRPDPAPADAFDWIVSPQAAIASALRCLDDENGRALLDSVLHERQLSARQLDALLARLPKSVSTLRDEFTGVPESGVESLFVRRVARAGHVVRPQVDVAGYGRFDGCIDGCVLFEVDGEAFHGNDRFFEDRDRTLVSQSYGRPVLRPTAKHVLDEWPLVASAVERVVDDAKALMRLRGLPPLVD